MQTRNSQDGLATTVAAGFTKTLYFTTLKLHVGFYYCLFFSRGALVAEVYKTSYLGMACRPGCIHPRLSAMVDNIPSHLPFQTIKTNKYKMVFK